MVNNLLSNIVVSYASSIFGFLISVLSARMLGAEQFAWMAFGLAVAGFAIPVLNLGNERTFVRDAVAMRHAEDVENMINISFGIRMMLTLIFSVLLAVASLLYTSNVIEAVAMFSISLWASLLGLYPSSWYDYLHETKKQNILVLMERIASLGLVVALFFLPKYLHLAFVIGIVLLCVRVSSIAIQVKVWWRMFGADRFKLRLSLTRYNVGGVNYHVTVALVFNAIATYGNQLILSHYNKVEVASYGFVFQIMSLILIFQGLGVRLMSRQVAETCKLKIGIFRSIFKHATLLVLGSSILAFAAWVGIKFLPRLLADSRYELMNRFSLLLCVWVVVVAVGQVVTQHSLALHQESLYLKLAISGGVIAFLLGVVFVPAHGGVAVASILLGVNSLMILTELARVAFIVRIKEAT